MGVIKNIETFSVKTLNPKWKFYVNTVIVKKKIKCKACNWKKLKNAHMSKIWWESTISYICVMK